MISATTTTTTTKGFGFQEERSGGYHFDVVIDNDGAVTVIERYSAKSGTSTRNATDHGNKVTISARRWELIQGTVTDEFNQRLRQSRMKPARWSKRKTVLAPHFGKELMLLLWAIEDQDQTVIPRMVANWRALAPEERWWFYTTVNATNRLGSAPRAYGWRAAIKIAFLDEPRDIGLTTLQITGHERNPDDDNEKPVATLPKPDAIQGKLFAVPDRPDYQI